MLNFLRNMPMWMKVTSAITVVATMGASLAFLKSPKMLLYLGFGVLAILALVGLILFIRFMIGKMSRRTKEKALVSADGKTDELSAKFEEGISRFKSSGKDLYSLPWYLFLGAPGSGKTWAIRKSGINFPPEFSGSVKGHAGTKGMDWWFSDEAVVLDTAGEMTIQEDPMEKAVSDRMWDSFLGKLKKFRPNEPINGVFLTLPAESILTDSEDALVDKATQIYQRLNSIQKNLSVRFPLYIVITKCDKICGFRDFWQGVDSIQDVALREKLRSQMLGWCNPDALDAPFDAHKLLASLNDLTNTLKKYRLGLLNPSDDAQVEQSMASIYAFPPNLEKMITRLEMYITRILPGHSAGWGESAVKPVFVRGLYFTSAMQEGSVLDAAVEQLLGVKMEDLGAQSANKDKFYFLKDIFFKKAFSEKGLISIASDTKKQQRKKKFVVLTFLGVSLLVLICLTLYSSISLKENIGNQLAAWEKADSLLAEQVDPSLPLLIEEGDDVLYAYNKSIEFDDKTYSQLGFLKMLSQLKGENIEIPWVFRSLSFSSINSESLQRDRNLAHCSLVGKSIITPLVELAEKEFAKEGFVFDQDSIAAMQEIVKLRTAPKMAALQEKDSFNATPFLKALLSEQDFEKVAVHLSDIQGMLAAENLYSEVYPPRALNINFQRDEVDYNLAAKPVFKKMISNYGKAIANGEKAKNLGASIKLLKDFNKIMDSLPVISIRQQAELLDQQVLALDRFETKELIDNVEYSSIDRDDVYDNLLRDLKDLQNILVKTKTLADELNIKTENLEKIKKQLALSLALKKEESLANAYDRLKKEIGEDVAREIESLYYISSSEENPEELDFRNKLKGDIKNLIRGEVRLVLDSSLGSEDLELIEKYHQMSNDLLKKKLDVISKYNVRKLKFDKLYGPLLTWVDESTTEVTGWKQAKDLFNGIRERLAEYKSSIRSVVASDLEKSVALCDGVSNNIAKKKMQLLAVSVNDSILDFAELTPPKVLAKSRKNPMSSDIYEHIPTNYKPEYFVFAYNLYTDFYKLYKQSDILDFDTHSDLKSSADGSFETYMNSYLSFWLDFENDALSTIIEELQDKLELNIAFKQLPLVASNATVNTRYSLDIAEYCIYAAVVVTGSVGENLKEKAQEYQENFTEDYKAYWLGLYDNWTYRPDELDGMPWAEAFATVKELDQVLVKKAFIYNLKLIEDSLKKFNRLLKLRRPSDEESRVLGLIDKDQELMRNSSLSVYLRKWQMLGSKATLASSKLLAQRAAHFDKYYSVEAGGVSKNYYRAMIMALLNSLSKSHEQAKAQEVAAFQQKLGFPLVLSKAKGITRENLTLVKEKFTALSGQATTSVSSLEKQDAIDTEMNELIATLRPKKLKNVEEFTKVLNFMENYKTVQVKLYGLEQQPARSQAAYMRWRKMDIGTLKGIKTDAPKEYSLGAISQYTPREEDFFLVRLYDHLDSKEPSKTITIDSKWPIFRMLYDGDIKNKEDATSLIRSAERLDGGKDWAVTLQIKDESGKFLLMKLKLSFSEALPLKTRWPVLK